MKIKDKEIYEIFLSLSYSQLKDLFRKAKSKQEQDFIKVLVPSTLILKMYRVVLSTIMMEY
ncbi:hypothetical protein [Clostridium estertheticum]|uniref:Uncharacterized protein n=1 Tax=Clostridium estertheticum TaxID=238834 RepID=A0AA47EF16_9CLOT|nr:hypothetical protein [Clostridium estertheticum]MBU3156480.1 hypothetical protein [Clostridium estertheticum]WAG58937.1 hypothetical protein LL038_14945 [Clostridium estertheticum]